MISIIFIRVYSRDSRVRLQLSLRLATPLLIR
jgi:hypothetical protein